MLTVAKFGGSSLADAERFLRVREIVRADPSRRVVVVSAAGKRHPGDHKTTDLLYLCHAYLQYHVPCWELWRRIAERYIEIRNGCGLQIPIEQELDAIREAGTWREERIITTPQYSRIDTTAKKGVVNLCANNYLGLSTHPALIEAAKESYDRWGFGLSSVRFICGTQEIHKELERRIAKFAGTDDAILYSSCFDANGGLFETLLGPEDAVISDELNHASIIDGVRLCKAKRYRYLNNNMEDLEAKLKDARESGCKKILIATDGVFSMDGYIANLKAICDLADRYDALTMVDDSHAVGFMGAHGRGTAEFCGVIGRVDIITGTFGKAMGGASGGYTAARQPIVDLLRQRSRPYLFSNTLAPAICAATIRTIDLLEESTALRAIMNGVIS